MIDGKLRKQRLRAERKMMSLHNNPKYQLPELIAALDAHGLHTNTPSQLSDVFRTGWVAALAQPAPDAPKSKLLTEHSGCGHGTQVDQLTVRLNPGDKVVLVMGRYSAAVDAGQASHPVEPTAPAETPDSKVWNTDA